MKKNIEIELQEYPTTDPKWEGDRYIYCEKDGFSKLSDRGVGSFSLEQNPHNKELFDVYIEIEADESKRDGIKEDIRGLLDENFEQIPEFNERNGGTFSVKIPNVKENDFMRILLDLSDTKDRDRHQSHYPMLGRDVASKMIEKELDRRDIDPVMAGLSNVSIVEIEREGMQTKSYVDVDLSGYPLSPVQSLSEDSEFGADLDNRLYTTKLYFEQTQVNFVSDALRKSGLNIVSYNKEQGWIKTEATADMVSEALCKAKMLPDSIHQAVKTAADQAHSEQRGVNAALQSQAPKPKSPQSRFNTRPAGQTL